MEVGVGVCFDGLDVVCRFGCWMSLVCLCMVGGLCLLLCGFARLGLLVGVCCVPVCVVVYSLR